MARSPIRALRHRLTRLEGTEDRPAAEKFLREVRFRDRPAQRVAPIADCGEFGSCRDRHRHLPFPLAADLRRRAPDEFQYRVRGSGQIRPCDSLAPAQPPPHGQSVSEFSGSLIRRVPARVTRGLDRGPSFLRSIRLRRTLIARVISAFTRVFLRVCPAMTIRV